MSTIRSCLVISGRCKLASSYYCQIDTRRLECFSVDVFRFPIGVWKGYVTQAEIEYIEDNQLGTVKILEFEGGSLEGLIDFLVTRLIQDRGHELINLVAELCFYEIVHRN